MKLNLHPKSNMLLLAAMKEAEVSKGGIIIPGNAQRLINQGIILEIGPDVPLDDGFLLNEIVVFPQHMEFRMEDDDTGEMFYLVRSTDIIAGDRGERAADSEGGMESLKKRKEKRPAVEDPTIQKGEKRKPVGLCTCMKDYMDIAEVDPKCPLHGEK